MANWQRNALAAHAPFRQAGGDIEFSTDGTSVNTWEGWREMRLGIFSKRHRGESATPEQWDDRELPSPHVRVAFAAIEKSDRFGTRWGVLDAPIGNPRHDADFGACRRSRLDLGRGLRAFPRSHGRIGHLPCTGAHRRRGQDRLRRRNGSLPTMDRFCPQCRTFRRLACGAATLANDMATHEETIASEAASVAVALSGQTPLASWLCSAIGRGTVDWQRASGGGVQAHDRSKVETNRSPMEGSSGQPDGKSVCPHV